MGCGECAPEDEAVVHGVGKADFIGHHYLCHHETLTKGFGVIALDIRGMAGRLDCVLCLCAHCNCTKQQCCRQDFFHMML